MFGESVGMFGENTMVSLGQLLSQQLHENLYFQNYLVVMKFSRCRLTWGRDVKGFLLFYSVGASCLCFVMYLL